MNKKAQVLSCRKTGNAYYFTFCCQLFLNTQREMPTPESSFNEHFARDKQLDTLNSPPRLSESTSAMIAAKAVASRIPCARLSTAQSALGSFVVFYCFQWCYYF